MAKLNLTQRMNNLEKTIGEFVHGVHDRLARLETDQLNKEVEPLLETLDLEERRDKLDELWETPLRHMKKWTDKEMEHLKGFVISFAYQRAKDHQRTPEAIYFKIRDVIDDMDLEGNDFGGQY